MPKRPQKPCAHPGCPKLTDGRFCEEHKKEAQRRYDKFQRSPESNRAYGRAWKRIRDRYAQAHPYCERCFAEGRMVPMKEVHHILPIKRGGAHDKEKLMALCQSCHTKIHNELGDR